MKYINIYYTRNKYIFLLMCYFSFSFSQTSYSLTTYGEISGEETWSGVVQLKGDVTVTSSGELTILPGTRIECDANVDAQIGGVHTSRIEIIVDNGSLIAQGTETSPIVFTSSSTSPVKGDWYGLIFYGENISLKNCQIYYGINGITVNSGNPSFSNLTINENKEFGLHLKVNSTLSDLIISNNQTGIQLEKSLNLDIKDSLIEKNTKDGIYLWEGVLTIENCQILNNSTDGRAGINGWRSTVNARNCQIAGNGWYGIYATKITVDNCVISNTINGGAFPGHGICDCSEYGGGYVIVKNNSRILDNDADGIGSYYGSNSSAIIENSIISGNKWNGIASAFIAELTSSEITYNTNNGISNALSSNGSIISYNGKIGINITTSSGELINNIIQNNNIGIQTSISTDTYSWIYFNDVFDNHSYELKNNGAAAIIANVNYWGEPTTTELNQEISNLTKIYDSRDDSSVGQVILNGWKNTSTNPTPTPTNTPYPPTATFTNTPNPTNTYTPVPTHKPPTPTFTYTETPVPTNTPTVITTPTPWRPYISIEVPPKMIYVTDDGQSTENLMDKTDYDAPSDRALMIHWNIGGFLSQPKAIQLNVAGTGTGQVRLAANLDPLTTSFEWREGNPLIFDESVKGGPQFNKSYRFTVIVNLTIGSTSSFSSGVIDFSDIPTPTPTFTNTPIPTPTYTPTLTPTNTIPPVPLNIPVDTVVVTDHLQSTEKLNGGYDIDVAHDRALAVRWNYSKSDAANFHIYVKIDNGFPQFLGQTKSGSVYYFEWRIGNPFLTDSFVDGPQYKKLYKFLVYAITSDGAYLLTSLDPVLFWDANEILPTPTYTTTPKPTDTPRPTPTDAPKPTPTNTPKPTPTNTPKPTPTDTPKPTPTDTPNPPTATSTPFIAVNLIPNPSFNIASGSLPMGWENPGSGGNLIWDRIIAHSFSSSVKIAGSSVQNYSLHWSTIDLIEFDRSKQYLLTFWYLWDKPALSGDVAEIGIRAYNDEGDDIGLTTYYPNGLAGDWRYAQFIIPKNSMPESAKYVKLYFGRFMGSTESVDSILWYDDVSLRIMGDHESLPPTLTPYPPTPTNTFTHTPTSTNSPTPTNTLTPTDTPRPTNTPTHTPIPSPTPIMLIDVPLNLYEGSKPLELVYIPSGTFLMGSPSYEKGRDPNEGPQHEVTISRPFYMSKYEITQEQWFAVMNVKPSVYGGSNYPVDAVSWEDCNHFIEELNKLNIGNFRLPTEAEWEYACRADSTERFYWGEDESNTEINNYAWNWFNSRHSPQTVGGKSPNDWGLYDMSGNQNEWCADWYTEYNSSSVIDPQGPNEGENRVVRGGFFDSIGGCRSAARDSANPKIGIETISFRIVRDFTFKPTPIDMPTPIDTPPPDIPTPDMPTPTPEEPDDPIFEPTPDETSKEPGIRITTREILQRTNGGTVTFQVIVEGFNGFNEEVRLQVRDLPDGFDAQFSHQKFVPNNQSTLIISPRDKTIFNGISGDIPLVDSFLIQALSGSDKVEEIIAYLHLLPYGAPLYNSPVPREPFFIDLRTESRNRERIGDKVVIRGEIHDNPGIRWLTVSALRPGESVPIIDDEVEISKRGGNFVTEFLVEKDSHLVLNNNDTPWKIEAFYKGTTWDNPFRAASNPLYLKVGSENPALSAKQRNRYLNVVTSTGDGSHIFSGHVIIVGGVGGLEVNTKSIEMLTTPLYHNLIDERRFDEESIHYLAPTSDVDPSVGVISSYEALEQAISDSQDANYLILYLVGSEDGGFFQFASKADFINGGILKNLLRSRIQDKSKYTLVILDAPQAGIMRESMPDELNFEMIASTGSTQDSKAIFGRTDEGQPFSFSDLFFDALLRGENVKESLKYARIHLRRIQEPNIFQIPVPLEGELKEPFASLVLGSAYVPQGKPLEDNLPPRIIDIPSTIQIVRGETLKLKARIRDEERDDEDVSNGEDVLLNVRITQHGTSINHDVSARFIKDDEFEILEENFPEKLFGPNASNGQYTLNMLVQDNTGNSTAPAITSIEVVGPARKDEFEQDNPNDSGWNIINGGFGGAQPGAAYCIDFKTDDSLIPSSHDKKGLAISVKRNQVVLVHAMQSFPTKGKTVLIRATMRSNSPHAAVWLTALKGDFNTLIDVDESQSLITNSHSSVLSSGERKLIALYHPVENESITPLIQVAGLDMDGVTTVLIDRVELYEIDDNLSYPSELFSSYMNVAESQLMINDPEPFIKYDFSQKTLQDMNWRKAQSDFTGAPEGSITPVDFPYEDNLLFSSDDRRGLAFTVQSGQVAFAFSEQSLQYTGYPYLIKVRVQSVTPDASLWLVGLKGNLITGAGIDGSLGFRQWANVSNSAGREKTIILLYEPDEGEWMTPAIQVASPINALKNSIYIDKMEIYSLEPGKAFAGELFSN